MKNNKKACSLLKAIVNNFHVEDNNEESILQNITDHPNGHNPVRPVRLRRYCMYAGKTSPYS